MLFLNREKKIVEKWLDGGTTLSPTAGCVENKFLRSGLFLLNENGFSESLIFFCENNTMQECVFKLKII